MRIELAHLLMGRAAASLLASAFLLVPQCAFAEGLFEMFFGALQKQNHLPAQANFFADPSQQNQLSARPVSGGPAFCVRSCDGKYFPLVRANISPVQMCQAFCPASPTRVFFGSNIDNATTANGERYADSENAFAYRKALRADCTCNGRDAAGLVPVDLTLDTSLRAGDVIATTDGLVAYSGIKVGNANNPEFLPVASYPGLTPEVRARLGNMKVAPVTAEALGSDASTGDLTGSITPAPKSTSRDRRAASN